MSGACRHQIVQHQTNHSGFSLTFNPHMTPWGNKLLLLQKRGHGSEAGFIRIRIPVRINPVNVVCSLLEQIWAHGL